VEVAAGVDAGVDVGVDVVVGTVVGMVDAVVYNKSGKIHHLRNHNPNNPKKKQPRQNP
jgi:hypothetical protein